MVDHGPNARVRVLVSPEQYFDAAPLMAKVDAVTAPTLATMRDELQRFTRAGLEAVRFYSQNRQAWVEAMVRRLN